MILPLDQQVTSLELSMKLEELGVPQDSLWMWLKLDSWPRPKLWCVRPPLGTEPIKNIYYWKSTGHLEWAYSAFTVAELGEMLPMQIIENEKEYFLNYFKTANLHILDYMCWEDETPTFLVGHFGDITEAEARGKVIMRLINSGKVKV